MIIRFTKGYGKPDRLSCTREDGSATWAALRFTQHDFGHYAIETTLGWQDAFFGLLAQGWSIAQFGQADPVTGHKPVIPVQACQAEAIAGLLDVERRTGNPSPYPLFAEMLACSCEGLGLPIPCITPENLAAIHHCQDALCRRWEDILPGETLALSFPLSFSVLQKGFADGA